MDSSGTPAPVRPAPIMDVAPPPKADVAASASPAEQPINQSKAALKSAPKPKTPSHSTTLAVALALVLFVGLSALAFYAYIKSN